MSAQRIHVWVQEFKNRPSLFLQWLDPLTGKRKTKSAETARADLEADLNAGRHQEASRMSWERFREMFETDYVSGLRADTQDNYADTFDVFERLCHPTSLRTVNEQFLSRFVGVLRKQPGHHGRTLQESTIKVRLQFLRTALRWAAEKKLIPACPRFPVIKPPKKKPQPVPVETFERLLQKAPDQNMRVYLQCGWLGGLRLNEARLLEWEETDAAPYIDFAAERIVFPAGFVKAKEDQWVPLDPELCAALESLPRHGKKVFRFLDRCGKEVGDRAVSNRVSELARQAGVRLTMKSLRRGFGCRYAARVPAQVLQKLMRHSSIDVTMTYYANVDDAVMRAVLGDECKHSRKRQPMSGQEQPRANAASAEETMPSE